MDTPPMVSPQEWEAAREQMLVKEKELTRARDALAAERRRMPRMLVEEEYEFEGPDGRVSLLDMFEGRRQLIIYRFFYEPGVNGWPEKGCPGCSMMADQRAHPAHVNARDTTVEMFTDRQGGDYLNFEVKASDRGEICKAACDGEQQCRAWTYVRAGYIGAAPRCFLKAEVKPPRRKPCCISGVVR